MFTLKSRIIIFLFLIVAFSIPIALLAIPLPYYRIDNRSTVRTEAASDGAVRFVKNNSITKDYFLPNRTSNEWLSFRNNAPTDIEFIQACSASTVCGSTCFVFEPPSDTLNVVMYDTVQIGLGTSAQCWMTDNLRTRYNYAGTAITQWNYGAQATSPYNRFACMGTSNNCPGAEVFYQPLSALAATDYLPSGSSEQGVQGICPPGWRIPSEADVEQLATLTGCANEQNVFDRSCLYSDGMDIDNYGLRAGSTGTTYYSNASAQFLLANRILSGSQWVYSLMHVDEPHGQSSNASNGFSVRCMKGGGSFDGGGDEKDPGGGIISN